MATDRDIRDALQLLAERAPATCPVPGDGSIGTVGRPDGDRSRGGRQHRPWTLIATVAALVVLVAGIIAYTVTGLSGSSGSNSAPPAGQAGSVTTVYCTSPSGQDVSADRPAIQRRLAALGGKDISVTASGADLAAAARGVKAAELQNLCDTGALDLRGLVAPPVPVTCSPSQAASCSSAPITRGATPLPFGVPTSEAAYGRLSSHQQQQLTAWLASYNCGSTATDRSAADSAVIACADGSNFGVAAAKVALLLGPAIVSNPQVDAASAVAPNAQSGAVEWTVDLTASPAGQAAIAEYTTAHNTGGAQPQGTALQCSAATTPCADYIGYTVDGSVVSIPVTIQAISGGNTQLAGQFTSSSARGLASALTGGPLPVPLHVHHLK